jgi:hypothetical protein
MSDITVRPVDDTTYRVTVSEASGSSEHLVTLSAEDAARLGPGVPETELIRASFEFLLEREPKESILGAFELPVIARYFPSYPDEIGSRLQS